MPIAQVVLAKLFPSGNVPSRHLNTPLLQERCEYISHLLLQGFSMARVKEIASMQINAIELLNITQARPIQIEEMREAASKWAVDVRLHVNRKPGKVSYCNFTTMVREWLKFSGLLVELERPKLPLDSMVKPYLGELHFNGLLETTIATRCYHLVRFQKWLDERGRGPSEVSLADVDDYLEWHRAKGWCQASIGCLARILRYFFRYCESQNWCGPQISRGILIPRVRKNQTGPRGPAWKDVRRMLQIAGTSPPQLRAKAVISLFSIYALRRSEVMKLRLEDFDWYNEIMTVRRAKRGRVQQFPIQYEVGEAILAYLKSARTKSSCRNLFLTFRVPVRPLGKCQIGKLVTERMKDLGIKSQNRGPHALRHSCASRLLDCGFTLQEIADFLGHRGLESVSIYAKFNPRLLRRVASFSLAGIQ